MTDKEGPWIAGAVVAVFVFIICLWGVAAWGIVELILWLTSK